MSSTKHEKGDSPSRGDLERNPGTGQSKGAIANGEKPRSIEDENTTEGDVDNGSTLTDGVPEGEPGRTNA